MDQDELWNEVKLNTLWHEGGDDALSHQRALEKINKEARYPRSSLAHEELKLAVELWSVGLMHATVKPHQQIEGALGEPKSEALRVVFLRYAGGHSLLAGVHRIGKWHREQPPTEIREVIIVTSTRGAP